jgi:hypothetical protein
MYYLPDIIADRVYEFSHRFEFENQQFNPCTHVALEADGRQIVAFKKGEEWFPVELLHCGSHCRLQAAFDDHGHMRDCSKDKTVQIIRCRKTYLVRFHNGATLNDLSKEFALLLAIFGNDVDGQCSITQIPNEYADLFSSLDSVPTRSVTIHV